MKREVRYAIFKISDLDAFTNNEIGCLKDLLDRQDQLRKYRGASPLTCVVVEHDWPEYEQVWKMIENRMDNPCKIGTDYKGTCSEGTKGCYVDHPRYRQVIG